MSSQLGTKTIRKGRSSSERAIEKEILSQESCGEDFSQSTPAAELTVAENALATAPLRQIQAWLQTFITADGSPQQAVAAAQAASGMENLGPTQLILPSLRLNPQQLLMIYRNQYLLRMEEALSIDFPVLLKYFGSEKFFQLVSRYVERYPSRSWTLNHLGASMERFLRELGEEKPVFDKRLELLAEVAAVEWTLAELMDEKDDPCLSIEQIAQVAPGDWALARFTPISALRCLTLKYPVQQWLAAERDGEDLPTLRPKTTHLVMWRKEDDLWRQPFDSASFELLGRLLLGEQVGSAMDSVLAGHKMSPKKLFDSFSTWLAEGFFAEVQFDPN